MKTVDTTMCAGMAAVTPVTRISEIYSLVDANNNIIDDDYSLSTLRARIDRNCIELNRYGFLYITGTNHLDQEFIVEEIDVSDMAEQALEDMENECRHRQEVSSLYLTGRI